MVAKSKAKSNDQKYKIGNDRQTSFGSINIRIPIPKNKFITLPVYAVNANVLFKSDFDLFDKYRMLSNTVSNQLCSPFLNLQLSLICKSSHVYL